MWINLYVFSKHQSTQKLGICDPESLATSTGFVIWLELAWPGRHLPRNVLLPLSSPPPPYLEPSPPILHCTWNRGKPLKTLILLR